MKKKIYITTPIFYVNDLPHIGHSYTSIICDALARFYRLNNFDVLFTTGTDEHGLKVEKAAEKSGMTPNSFVDKVSKNFRELLKKLIQPIQTLLEQLKIDMRLLVKNFGILFVKIIKFI